MAGDPTTPERPVRRTFTAKYKLEVLTEYESATGEGARGAILRCGGLYGESIRGSMVVARRRTIHTVLMLRPGQPCRR